MAKATINLQKRIRQRLLILLCAFFLIMAIIISYLVSFLHQSSLKQELLLKHREIEQFVNGYLIRAEDDIRLIGQTLALDDYEKDSEVDLLLGRHEVISSEHLDFWYVEWNLKGYLMDSRARLFASVDLQSLLVQGLINRWVVLLPNDDSILLMHKKEVLSDDQENIGFIYGFISLKNNSMLTNELLDFAKVDSVKIYDNVNKRTLLDIGEKDETLLLSSLNSSFPFSSLIQADLWLDISQENAFSVSAYTKVIPFFISASFVLFVFYLIFVRQIKHLVFTPFERASSRLEKDILPFDELQPIQRQHNQNEALINAKENRFKQLIESIHCAIIFCNDVTEIEVMNAEAKVLFPDSHRARTIFDFMPVSCHQPIQEAFKGKVGISFDLTISSRGVIYTWQSYVFTNESSNKGLLLVGRNTTKETSLLWQLEQLQPLSVSVQNKVDTELILNELTYLSRMSNHISTGQLQGWIVLLVSVLENVGDIENGASYLPIGNVLAKESSHVIENMGIAASQISIDCSLENSMTVIAINENFRSLIRILFMMISNDTVERCLTVRVKENRLELIVMHDMASRPLFFGMIKSLLVNLGGEQKTLRNNAFQLDLPIKKSEFSYSFKSLSTSKTVAWIMNDYPTPALIKQALIRLGLNVEEYASADSFCTQYSEVRRFDAVLIGCDRDTESQLNITKALKHKYQRDQLPVIWLNNSIPENLDLGVFSLSGCPFDFSLHQVLLKACEIEGIAPINSISTSSSWVIVGGSRVGKAVWYAELERYDISVLWLPTLTHNKTTLSYDKKSFIILLDQQPSNVLESIQAECPNLRVFSVQWWAEMPEYVTFIEMARPYSSDKVDEFIQCILQQS